MSGLKVLYKNKLFWFFEHTFFVCLPLMVFTSYLGSPAIRYSMLALSSIYMVGIAYLMGARLSNIGLTTKHFSQSLKFILTPTLLIGALILLFKHFYPFILPQSSNLIWYLVISVPLQEILFRGFCLWRCKITWRSATFIILFNSFLFAMYHMLFNNWYLTIGVFLVNIFWSLAFLKYPNLYSTMLSHAFLGAICFISIF